MHRERYCNAYLYSNRIASVCDTYLLGSISIILSTNDPMCSIVIKIICHRWNFVCMPQLCRLWIEIKVFLKLAEFDYRNSKWSLCITEVRIWIFLYNANLCLDFSMCYFFTKYLENLRLIEQKYHKHAILFTCIIQIC